MKFDARLAVKWKCATDGVLASMILDDFKACARRGLPALAQLSAASLLAASTSDPEKR